MRNSALPDTTRGASNLWRVKRAPGWIRLVGIGLELSALAFIAYVLMGDEGAAAAEAPRFLGDASIPQHDTAAPDEPTSEPVFNAAQPPLEQPTTERLHLQPMDFIVESADGGARYYRAGDSEVEVLAGFYSDGRMRLASPHRRFAGMLENGRADLLEIDSNQWSEVFVRETPSGTMQLELRGGPYDAHVLTCETLRQAQGDTQQPQGDTQQPQGDTD